MGILLNKTKSLLKKSASLLKEFTSKRDKLISINIEATVEQDVLQSKVDKLNIQNSDLDRMTKVNISVIKNINKIIGE